MYPIGYTEPIHATLSGVYTLIAESIIIFWIQLLNKKKNVLHTSEHMERTQYVAYINK